jgi:CheY-like chemotaxis protein
MDIKDIDFYYKKFKSGEDNFHELMQKRIREILLIAPFYDAFIFEQDGRLSEQINGEYMQLNLSTAPRITNVPTGQQALELLKTRNFDLVITMMRIGELTPFELSYKIKQDFPQTPILLLLNVHSDIALIDKTSDDMKHIDNVFIWNGDSKIFLSMVKCMEDKWNVEKDTRIGHVRVILLVEDSIQYYSKFHPLLYAEILKQTQKLISEELNDVNKRDRMRGRPKVLLCHSYEEAVELFEKYSDNVSAIISDTRYYLNNKLDSKAGIKLINYVKNHGKSCPIILQSSEAENAKIAEELQVHFLHKNSTRLLHDLQKFIKNNLGFGDFVFKDESGKIYDRAKTLDDFEQKLHSIPDESLLYHGRGNHFSSWLAAHSEFLYSNQLRSINIDDFKSADDLRKLLLLTFSEVKHLRNKGKVINFEPHYLDLEDSIIRLSEGSFGGKGRGLSFLNSLLTSIDFEKKFEKIRIKIPRTFIIGTSEFDDFIEENNLSDWVADKTDEEIKTRFIQSELSDGIKSILRIFLKRVNYPITVRSSGLLEDSQSQPFAGVYDTYMIPNNHPEIEMRLRHLSDAIKLVFSSVFMSSARNYIESIHYKLEEEKMAIIIQEIVGNKLGDELFFPLFSGVAQSYNFYPSSGTTHADGTVALAVGLGRAVVDGENALRFSPNYPRIDVMKPQDVVANNQNVFYAVDLSVFKQGFIDDEDSFIKRIEISDELKQGHFKTLTSVWDYQNNRFLDGELLSGPRVLTFRNLLYYNKIPLAEILKDLLEIGEVSFGVPVEIEFAVELKSDKNNFDAEFNLLQIRPLSVNQENIHVKLDELDREKLLLLTSRGMGNGIINDIRDIVFIDPEKFDNTQTLQIVEEIDKINKEYQKLKREYVLIGPGRWGTSDRFLGIPVRWDQINKARIIVEASQKNFAVDSSQGSHFFHNLVAMNACYFTVLHSSDIDFIDWDWLKSMPSKQYGECVFKVELKAPIQVKTDGKTGYATVSKN